MGVREGKIYGGGKTCARLFRIVPDQSRKNCLWNTLISATSPPSPKKFRSVYHFKGPKIFPDLLNFSEHQTPFPHITKLTTKIDIICPSSFYNKPILPDCEANIARLPLFAQQTGGFLAFLAF